MIALNLQIFFVLLDVVLGVLLLWGVLWFLGVVARDQGTQFRAWKNTPTKPMTLPWKVFYIVSVILAIAAALLPSSFYARLG